MKHVFFLLVLLTSLCLAVRQNDPYDCYTNDLQCTECVADPNCGFCGNTGECLWGDETGPFFPMNYSLWQECDGRWQYGHASMVLQTESSLTIDPSKIDIFLIPNDPVTFPVKVRRPIADSIPLDLVFLQNTVNSMKSYLVTFSSIVPLLLDGVLKEYKTAQFGYAKSIDKPISPFGGAWGSSQQGDYIWNIGHSIHPSPAKVLISAYRAIDEVNWGGDDPSGLYEALGVTARCQKLMGYREGSRTIIFGVTDANYHVSPDFDTASANPIICYDDPDDTGIGQGTGTDLYYYGIYHDYPNYVNMRTLLLQKNIVPVFITTKTSVEGPFQELVTLSTKLNLGYFLPSDGATRTFVINVLAIIEEIAGTIRLLRETPDTSYVTVIDPTIYYNVKILEQVTFMVTVNSANPMTVTEYLVSLGFGKVQINYYNTIPCFGCDGVAGSGEYLNYCGICKPEGIEETLDCRGCDGVPNSGAVYDICDICGGDGTSCRDCLGIPNGGAEYDDCDICAGTNACFGCDGQPYSFKIYDACGVCGGDDRSCMDCSGTINGNATEDDCGICNGGNACLGCDGVPFSGLIYDACGVCGGNNDCLGCDGFGSVLDQCFVCNGTGTTCLGCDGVPFSGKVEDACGVCGGANECQDCFGVINGTAVVDDCGVCGGTGMSCKDCTGTIGGTLIYDTCGVCGGSNTCYGCDGVKFSNKTVDVCGICGGDEACVGCDGVPYSGATLDFCDVCLGNNSCLGCDNIPNSGNVLDECGICGGDSRSCQGCDGVPNSGLKYDKCGICGGNNTCLVTIDITPPNNVDITTVGIGVAIGAAVIAIAGAVGAFAAVSGAAALVNPLFYIPAGLGGPLRDLKESPIHEQRRARENLMVNH